MEVNVAELKPERARLGWFTGIYDYIRRMLRRQEDWRKGKAEIDRRSERGKKSVNEREEGAEEGEVEAGDVE